MNTFKKERSKKSDAQERGPLCPLQKIKTELRSWYGSLSVKEIITNKKLTSEIENLEQFLVGKALV